MCHNKSETNFIRLCSGVRLLLAMCATLGLLQGCEWFKNVLGIIAELCGEEVYIATTATDSRDNRCTAEHCSLYDAVKTAELCNELDPKPRVIRLTARRFVLDNVDNDRNGPTSLPTITSEITIQGGDATIIERNEDGPPFRIFQVASSGVLTLEGLTVTKGRAEMSGGTRTANSGGAIYNNGVLTVRRSRLIENTASRDGGAIFNINLGVISIEESEVSANASLIGSGGAIYAEQGDVMVQNSVLQSNRVPSRHGGGIYVDTRAQLTISRSSLLDNRSAVDGGGIYSAGQSTVIASTFHGNVAGFSGGGVYVSGVMSIIDSTIAANQATGFSDGGGGMGTSLAGTITVSNTLLANTAGGGDCSVPIHLSVLARSRGNCPGLTSPVGSLPPPADHGGPTPTILLPPTSRAVDNGTECLPTDQRGLPRPRPDGGECDVGAFEIQ